MYVTALLHRPEKRPTFIDRYWKEKWWDRPVAAARQLWAKYENQPLMATVALQPRQEPFNMSTYE